MDSKITFIIPSVNRPTLKHALRSLVKQTNPNWECIVVYDGVNGPKFDDDRIKILKIPKIGSFGPNHGLAGLVRNFGIKDVKTEWIGFLDDDDSLDPNYVSVLFEKYFTYDFVVWRMKYTNGIVLPRFNSNDITFGDVGISFCYKSKLDQLFKNNKDGEDFDFLTDLKQKTSNYIIASEVTYNVNH